jgi:MFS family permease
MRSDKVKELAIKINKKLYYGWMIVLMSGLAFFFSAPGQTYSISVFINAYNQEFGYSSTLISSGYSIATMISGLLIIFMGKAIDRFGQRKMLIIVVIMLSITAFFNSFVSNIGMIFVGFFFLRYFGQGSMTLIPNSLVPQWFEKKRAFAISLSGIGNLIATLSIPAFNYWMITHYGWVHAWRVWSLVLLIGFVPLVILFIFNKPEDLGITMENLTAGTDEEIKASLLKMEAESFTLKQAVKTKEFWFVGLISTIPSMFTTGITFHFFRMMELRNVTNEQSALIIGLVAFPAFFMPFIARLVIDKYPTKYTLFVTLVLMIVSMGWLAWAVSNAVTAISFILFYGSAVAVQGVALNVLWPNYFGRKYLGSIRGAATVFMVLGSALGPLPFGIDYDISGGYNNVLIIMMIYTGITAILALLIKPPVKTEIETY